jgi:hypothetical protein
MDWRINDSSNSSGWLDCADTTAAYEDADSIFAGVSASYGGYEYDNLEWCTFDEWNETQLTCIPTEEEVAPAVGDSCDYIGSGNYHINCSDACQINSTQLSNSTITGYLNITDLDGAGTVFINTTLNITELHVETNCIVNLSKDNGTLQFH